MRKSDLRENNVIHRDGNLELKLYPFGNPPCHWHDELEFILPLQGDCLATVNGEQFHITEGQALLISSGELHSMEAGVGSQGHAIVLHPHICGSECAYLFSARQIKQVFDNKNKADAIILQHLKGICDAVHTRAFGYEFSVKAHVADVFRIIFEEEMFRQKPFAPSDSSEAFQKLISYLHENFAKKLTLDDLAAYCSYSKTYIVRLFKKYAGTTPIDYITRYRIIHAQSLLRSESKSVLEIAMECGFENVSYFIRTFQKYTGQSPGKWRRNQ